jgi:hypothetical protein
VDRDAVFGENTTHLTQQSAQLGIFHVLENIRTEDNIEDLVSKRQANPVIQPHRV